MITDWKFTYKLSPKCTYKNLPSTRAIKFTSEKDARGSSWVTGFIISIYNMNKKQAMERAKIKAKNIAIIISLKVGNPVSESHVGTCYKLHGKKNERWKVSSSLTSRYNIFENLALDISQGNIGRLIGENKPLNERIYHAYLGLKAYQEELYEAVIIQFYQAIEKVSSLSHIRSKYEPLRGILSHPEIQRKDTIKRLKTNFPTAKIQCTSSESFDYFSPKNNEFLKAKAKELMKSAMKYLRKELM